MDLRKQSMLNSFNEQLPAYDALKQHLTNQIDDTRNANKLSILTAIDNSYNQASQNNTGAFNQTWKHPEQFNQPVNEVPNNLIASNAVPNYSPFEQQTISDSPIKISDNPAGYFAPFGVGGWQPDSDTKSGNTGYQFLNEKEMRENDIKRKQKQNEAELKSKFSVKLSYPKGVYYVGKLDPELDAYIRWRLKPNAVVVNMKTIHFQNTIEHPNNLFNGNNSSLKKGVIALLAKNAPSSLENFTIPDISTTIYEYIDSDDYISYRQLGVDLNGKLYLSKDKARWYFDANVLPNLKTEYSESIGYYNGRKDLPLLDKFDPNASNLRWWEELAFGLFRSFDRNGANFAIIAETYYNKKNKRYELIPGHMTLKGTIPTNLFNK